MSAWKEMKTGPGKWTCKPECLKVLCMRHLVIPISLQCKGRLVTRKRTEGQRGHRHATGLQWKCPCSPFALLYNIAHRHRSELQGKCPCVLQTVHIVFWVLVCSARCVCVSTAWEFPANAHGPEATHCWEEEYEQVYLILTTLRWLNLKGRFFWYICKLAKYQVLPSIRNITTFLVTHCWVGMRRTSKLLTNFEVTWVDLNASLGGEEVPFRSYIRHITTFLMQGLQQFDRFSDFTESVAAILAMILLNATVVWKVFIGVAFLSWVVLCPFPLAPPIKSKKKVSGDGSTSFYLLANLFMRSSKNLGISSAVFDWRVTV